MAGLALGVVDLYPYKGLCFDNVGDDAIQITLLVGARIKCSRTAFWRVVEQKGGSDLVFEPTCMGSALLVAVFHAGSRPPPIKSINHPAGCDAIILPG